MSPLHRLGAPTAALLALALFPLGLVACGTTDDSTESDSRVAQSAGDQARDFGFEATGAQAEQVEATMRGYLNARAAGEWKRACSYLTNSIRRLYARLAAKIQQAKGQGCPGFVETAVQEMSPSERVALAKSDVGSVRLKGRRGYVIYGGPAREYVTPVLREAREWMIAGFVGSPSGGSR